MTPDEKAIWYFLNWLENSGRYFLNTGTDFLELLSFEKRQPDGSISPTETRDVSFHEIMQIYADDLQAFKNRVEKLNPDESFEDWCKQRRNL